MLLELNDFNSLSKSTDVNDKSNLLTKEYFTAVTLKDDFGNDKPLQNLKTTDVKKESNALTEENLTAAHEPESEIQDDFGIDKPLIYEGRVYLKNFKHN